jgi:hypothetical protein
VGFYDNIFDSDRMSLYVELGYPPARRSTWQAARRVLEDLKREGWSRITGCWPTTRW